MSDYPTGTVTFLFTDIQGSTALWEQYPDAMRAAMAVHDARVEESVAGTGGLVVRPRGEGDSRFAVFTQADAAVRAAAAIQRALANGASELPVPLSVRIGIHTGSADWREGDYYGSAVNRCARIRALAYGGQTLLSKATAELVRDSLPESMALVEIGTYPLKGLNRPETVFQLWQPDLPNEFPPPQIEAKLRSNLPQPLTTLIGRETETAQIKQLLTQPDGRLLTMTGPGGTGKTRLSLAVGHELSDYFPDGIFFVDLAPISDPALVMTTIAHTLGIREGGGRPPFDNLKDYLADREALLILDNLEQVIAVAPTIAQLLVAAPRIKLLSTSRIPLQIRGEHEFPVATLPIPPEGALLSAAQLLEYEAVRLFVRQAQAARPSFTLTAENANDVAGICRRLDGLPLAIEIAAARIRMLSPAALLKRLAQSMNMLVGGAVDLPARQQTLRGAIDWSYELLQPEEQTLFRRLGVFVGGFTLESAEAICNPDGELDVFSGIEALLRNSLMRPVEWELDEPRFDMLQTIRDFALEKMSVAGELVALRAAHSGYYTQEAFANMQRLMGPLSLERLELMEADHDNYRAALAWGLEPGNDISITCRICMFQTWFWFRHGHLHEGRAWSERAARATEGTDSLARAMSLNAVGFMQTWQGDLAIAALNIEEAIRQYEAAGFEFGLTFAHFGYGVTLINQGRDREAYTHMTHAAEMFDQAGDHWDKAAALIHLANVSMGLGDYPQALTWLRTAQPLAEQFEDPWLLAFALNNFGEVARAQGDYELARGYYARAQALFYEADAVGDQARLIHTMAYMALHDGDETRAEELFDEALADFRKLGNKRGIAECLAGLAAVGVAAGRVAWATTLLSAAEAQMATSEAAWWPADRVEIKRTRERLQQALDEGEFSASWERGQAMGLDQALVYVTDSAGVVGSSSA